MIQTLRPKDWSAEVSRVSELAAQSGMSISRLLRILEHEGFPAHYAGEKNLDNRAAADLFAWPRYRDNTPMFRLAPISNFVSIVPAHVSTETAIPVVVDRITEDTQAVVELGAGFGRNLFDIRDLIEHQFPNIKYFAGEISESGREAGHLIAGLEPDRASLTFHPYNHLDPDFSFIAGYDNVIFYTVHTIEQVTYISEKLPFGILDSVDNFVCIHEEPVGWQLNDELMHAVNSDNFRAQLKARARSVEVFAPIDEYRAANIPVRNAWNLNLIPVLRELERAGSIRIERIDRHYSGANIYNPTTRIVWTRP